MRRSEIRDSQITELLEKVRKRNYGSYLRSMLLTRIRHLSGASISFDFPVTALVGPNGSGKSTIMAAAASAYAKTNTKDFFFASIVGDLPEFRWEVDYELIDRTLSNQDALRSSVVIERNGVKRPVISQRDVKYFTIHRTLPAVTNPVFMRRHFRGNKNSTRRYDILESTSIRAEASKILGKDLSDFKLLDVHFTRLKTISKKKRNATATKDAEYITSQIPVDMTQQLFVTDGQQSYSEFNFGTGEASVLRLVSGVEEVPEQSLVLIEEIENGLHPLAVERLVEYLIAVAARKRLQVIFTTHSDYALNVLPPEGIWATLDGRIIQGRLSVESLRALSGRVDKRLAIFTEDLFAQKWVEAILRESLGQRFDEVGVYPLKGDGTAVKIHLSHANNPSINHKSLCVLDGDSKQTDNPSMGILRLPGAVPELTVFNEVRSTLPESAALLTAACQRPLSQQSAVIDAVNSTANTNRDPHLLFAQVGESLGLVSEEVIRGAFFSVWLQKFPDKASTIAQSALSALS